MLAEFGGNASRDPKTEQDITQRIIAIQRKKEEYLKLACNLYKVKQQAGDERSIDLCLREAYLHFYSHSLVDAFKNMAESDIVFSDRIRAEQTDHNEMLTRLLKEDPAQHARTANFHVVLTEGGNGLADITIDPLLTIEDKMPSSQKELFKSKTSVAQNLMHFNIDSNKEYHLSEAYKLSKTFLEKKKDKETKEDGDTDEMFEDVPDSGDEKKEEKKPEAKEPAAKDGPKAEDAAKKEQSSPAKPAPAAAEEASSPEKKPAEDVKK